MRCQEAEADARVLDIVEAEDRQDRDAQLVLQVERAENFLRIIREWRTI